MPTKRIYCSSEDESLFDEAEALANGNLSKAVRDALRIYISVNGPEKDADGFYLVDLDVGMWYETPSELKNNKFYGKLLFSDSRTGSGWQYNAVSSVTISWEFYLTKRGAVVVFQSVECFVNPNFTGMIPYKSTLMSVIDFEKAFTVTPGFSVYLDKNSNAFQEYTLPLDDVHLPLKIFNRVCSLANFKDRKIEFEIMDI